MKKFIFIISGFALVIGLTGLAYLYFPWKKAVANKLQAVLESRGFQNVDLTLSDLGLYGATLNNITLGNKDFPLSLKNIAIDYSPRELWDGNLQALSISGVSLEIKKEDGRWIVQGFGGETATPSAGLKFPVDDKEIAKFPLNRLMIDDSQLNIVSDQWKVVAPVKLEWQKSPEPAILLRLENLQLDAGNLSATAGQGNAEAKLSSGGSGWEGEWNLRDVQLRGGPADVPVMNGAGTVKAGADRILLDGELKSADSQHRAVFQVNYKYTAPQKADLILRQANMPWQGGTLAVDNVTIPLVDRGALQFILHVQQVSIGQLMEAMTGKRVSATGLVSGDLPLLIGKDGSVSLGEGTLRAAGPGVISMPPDIIPGDNEQVAMTREILKNFHYSGLSVALSSNDANGLSLLVALEGNNPDVYDGRTVKLNVRLVGDVLDFVRQNVMFMMDPKTLLKQGEK
ncbi:MAG: intermembrane phospholipid transport protein YdbH family protein [Micavibrio sp.]